MKHNILNSIQSSTSSTKRYTNNLADQAFDALCQRIDTGELQPNQRLVEAEIAKELGIGRTPVREAIKRLGAKGYASKLPKGGLIVTELSLKQMQSLFEIREALETMAIKLACKHVTEEQINKAEEYHIRSIEAIRDGDIEQYIRLNASFHEELYAACDNEQLLSLLRTFRYLYFNRRLVRMHTPREWDSQLKQHSRILEAVRKRNADRAEKALRRHLKSTLKLALQRL